MYPVNQPLLDGNELKYLAECIETGWISSEGPFVQKFENLLASYVGRKEAIAVSNGTSALQLAIDALGLPRGSEVILPSFTIISCATSLPGSGLIPVPVDCDPITFNISVEAIQKAISNKTSAIIVPHIYGLPVDIDPILNIADKYNLRIIEDAAEAIGQTYNQKHCGSFGDLSVFSFYPNKHITTGEGGMILTDNEAYAIRCRNMRNLDFDKERRYIHNNIGWNFRMTNLQAAVGCAQFEKLQRNISKKKIIGCSYNEALADIPYIQLPLREVSYAENLYWVYTIVLSDEIPLEASTVMNALHQEGVATRHFFYPLHKQPALQRLYPELKNMILPVSENLSEKGFYIPSGLGLNLEDIKAISIKIRKVLNSLYNDIGIA